MDSRRNMNLLLSLAVRPMRDSAWNPTWCAAAPQHGLEVHVPGARRQVAEGAVQRSPHVGRELHVRRDPGVPGIVQELQAPWSWSLKARVHARCSTS